MNRSLDYRTDFYSLGATFYELLTYQLPFDTPDVLELVHSHLAKQPLCPSQVNPEIPQILDDIVMKLMGKNAEERYQSAIGIQLDLEECLNQLHTTNNISVFAIGCQDISDRFQIPQKLYGREREIDSLLTAFEGVSGHGQDATISHRQDACATIINREDGTNGHRQDACATSSMMLISGYSGICKSALVQELYKPITQQRGYFISGKFDQYQRNIPYSAIVSAFQDLAKQLLTESEANLKAWREKLLEALGINGQVIIDVIPEIELIIRRQPAPPELGAAEAENRFNFVFQNFIKVFTKPEHPLTIFIDDLQWAESILEERNRMAREIHDSLAQAFTGIIVHLGAAKRTIATNPEQAQTHLKTVGELARNGLAEARRSVQGLRPQLLEDGDLYSALDRLAIQMSSHTDTRIVLGAIALMHN